MLDWRLRIAVFVFIGVFPLSDFSLGSFGKAGLIEDGEWKEGQAESNISGREADSAGTLAMALVSPDQLLKAGEQDAEPDQKQGDGRKRANEGEQKFQTHGHSTSGDRRWPQFDGEKEIGLLDKEELVRIRRVLCAGRRGTLEQRGKRRSVKSVSQAKRGRERSQDEGSDHAHEKDGQQRKKVWLSVAMAVWDQQR